MLNKISLFLSMMLITTFSHSEPRMINVNYGLLNYTYKTTSYTASFIQWNDEYAVTAKHVKNLPNSVYICGVGCDLQFFKHKASLPIIQWRDGIKGENVHLVGQNASRQETIITGFNTDRNVFDTDTKKYIGKLALATSVPGMSGGPIYGDDAKVIGMTIATVEKQLDNLGPNAYSVYIPYQTVIEQWNNFCHDNIMKNASIAQCQSK